MRAVRILLLVLLTLFTADVVQAAPAAVQMQLERAAMPADAPTGMPCHQADVQEQGTPPADAVPHGMRCHQCFACVTLLTAPVATVPVLPVDWVHIPYHFSHYQPLQRAPALRPPILA